MEEDELRVSLTSKVHQKVPDALLDPGKQANLVVVNPGRWIEGAAAWQAARAGGSLPSQPRQASLLHPHAACTPPQPPCPGAGAKGCVARLTWRNAANAGRTTRHPAIWLPGVTASLHELPREDG